jgi:general secretion pathway protein F
MPAFSYIALDSQGHRRKGMIEGDSARQVRQKLRDQHLVPVEVKMVSETPSSRRNFKLKRRQRIQVADLSLITRQMATLLNAGLPVEEVLQAVAEQTEKPHVQGTLLAVRSRVLEGHSLATGMKDFPKAFPQLYRATVAAGEQSGRLDLVLSRLAEYIEKQHQMRQKIRQALVYPSLMTSVAILVVVFLLIYVVPQIVGVFSDTQQSLPGMTIVLLALSHFIHSYGIYLLIFLALAFLLFRRGLKKYQFRRWLHMQFLRLPIIGNTLKIINSARFLRTFGILFAAGVPVLEAMNVACELIGLLPMSEAVQKNIEKVREGLSISQALKQTRYFSPMSIHLIASGESSGQLEMMLEKTADNQDHDVALLIDNVLALFEPMLILVMGTVVLFIVLAVLLPIFQLDALSGQS